MVFLTSHHPLRILHKLRRVEREPEPFPQDSPPLLLQVWAAIHLLCPKRRDPHRQQALSDHRRILEMMQEVLAPQWAILHLRSYPD